ncbi:MAG: hypothetical protein M3247_08945 [Thermoproteota archaeon]|nr:hypothetical protein [Thermoproteota archaeon]
MTVADNVSVSYYEVDSEQLPIAMKSGQTAGLPAALPENPLVLAVPVAAAKLLLANAPVLAVAADAVFIVAGSTANPIASATPAMIPNKPIASFCIVISLLIYDII